MIQSSEQHLKHMGIHEAALESHIFGIVGVLKQIVSCELFILIASEISLNDQVPRESKPAETFNGISLFFRNMNLSRTRGERLIIIRLLTQELQELFLILANELRNLGVSSGDLLEDGFEHLWLLLDQLTKLLEVGVIPQKFEAREVSTTGSTSSSASSLLATSLSSSFEQVDRFVVTSGRGAFWSSRLGCASGGGLLLLFLLDVFRNTIQKVFDGTIGVKESSPHCTVYITPGETHCLHLSHDSLALSATQQCGGVIECGALCLGGPRGGRGGSRRNSRCSGSRRGGWGGRRSRGRGDGSGWGGGRL